MSRHRNRKTAGYLPLMTLLIEALEERDSHDRPDEAKALRAFGELALRQVPTRGVFSPADGELYAAIELIAKKHLGLTTPRKNFFAATAKVEPFALRDEIESAANHLMTVSESGVLLRRTGIWGNARRVLRPALASAIPATMLAERRIGVPPRLDFGRPWPSPRGRRAKIECAA